MKLRSKITNEAFYLNYCIFIWIIAFFLIFLLRVQYNVYTSKYLTNFLQLLIFLEKWLLQGKSVLFLSPSTRKKKLLLQILIYFPLFFPTIKRTKHHLRSALFPLLRRELVFNEKKIQTCYYHFPSFYLYTLSVIMKGFIKTLSFMEHLIWKNSFIFFVLFSNTH